MKLTVSKKLLAGFLTVILIFTFTLGISYVGITAVDTIYTDLIKDEAQKVIKVKEMHAAVKQEVVGMRGYLILDDETTEQSFEKGHEEFLKQHQQLSQMIYKPEAVQMMKELQEIESEYYQFAGRVFELKRQNKTNEYTTLIATQGVNLVEKFDQKAEELSRFQSDLLTQGYTEATAEVSWTKKAVVALVIFAILVGIAISIYIGRHISRPVEAIADTAKKMAAGDLTVPEITVKNKDEVGELAASFNEMTENLRDIIRQVSLNSEQVAASAEQLTASAEQTSKATEQIADTIQDVAVATDKGVESANESSQKAEDISAGSQQIAVNAQIVTAKAMDASTKAVEGGKSVKTAVAQMNSISHTVHGLSEVVHGLGVRSTEISQIVEVITSIAAQTNLLALNAAIEAARAGDHGRGFAVVADEVRKLAEQSASSAQQISQLITMIQNETDRAVQSMEMTTKEVGAGIGAINVAGESFTQIESSVNEVTEQIQEVSAAVQQMAAHAQQMVQSMQVVSEVSENVASGTQEVTAATEEQLAAMEEITSSSISLSKMASELQAVVGKFKI
ncbi:MAG TPA: methyl-accepting chemotaxis protein [Candidatus Bathyarchaeia archaeon]|nr:methyl-accepting chemotaxis protein [Candidatus Bathyarchaeia archaeon]